MPVFTALPVQEAWAPEVQNDHSAPLPEEEVSALFDCTQTAVLFLMPLLSVIIRLGQLQEKRTGT